MVYQPHFHEDDPRHGRYGPPRHSEGLSTGELLWIGVGVLAIVALAANASDIARYIKIRNM